MAAVLLVTISISAFAAINDTGFTDVSPNDWFAEAVTYCRDNGLMAGRGSNAFVPNATMTRAELVTVLYRAAGEPAVTNNNPFTDVANDQWYTNGVLWAQQNNIVSGYGNGRFGTHDPVRREQIATILWRDAGEPETAPGTDFADENAISNYASAAVDWARANGIVNGKPGNLFDPQGSATRAEVATMLMNYTKGNTPPSETTGSVLVAYFSRWGNTDFSNDVDATTSASITIQDGERQGTTEYLAQRIVQQTGGDLHLIQTVTPYPADFNEVRDQNHQEIAEGARPVLASTVNIDDYDTIFIGYPVWATTVPTPVLSFLESYDLTGKTVIPFCTHDGYGAGSSYQAIANSSAGAMVEQGLALDSSDTSSYQQEVKTWLDGLGIFQPETADTPITITIGDVQLDGVLYNTPMAREFIQRLPATVSMGAYGGREYYGSAGEAITPIGEGQLRFDNGDITYCPTNNTLAIFYAQTDRPNLTMEVYPIGRVTSDLAVFDTLDRQISITFSRKD